MIAVLDDLGPIPGTWKEEPLDKCSICGEIDLQSREEMDAYHHDMSNRQWEEDESDVARPQAPPKLTTLIRS